LPRTSHLDAKTSQLQLRGVSSEAMNPVPYLGA